MDFFKQRYYRTTKLLISIIGQWPYDNIRVRFAFVALIMAISTGQVIPMIMAVFKNRDDRAILLDCVSAMFYGSWSLIKLMTFVWNSKKMVKILDRISDDWLVWSTDREINVLHEYAESGRKMSIIYAVTMYAIAALYATQPIVPKIIDVLLRNGSEPGKFPFAVYYYHLDEQKYYFYIIVYMNVFAFMVASVSAAYGVMLIAFVQHGCAIFAAVGHKLQRIGKNETTNIAYRSERKNEIFEDPIISCIVRHNEAIEYAKLIETTCTWSFLLMVILRIAIVCLTGLQIITRTNDLQELVKFMAFASGLIAYVYLESYLGQKLMDHSISIRSYIQNSQWYSLSLKAQKLLQFMTMRCNIPCQLTAGRMINVSVESFTVFLKTSLSYLTVLRTMQVFGSD